MDMNQQQQRLVQAIRKVEMFKRLMAEETLRLLHICRPQYFEPNQQVYRAGEPGTDMLILLQGLLVATSKSGEVLGQILPGSSTGEMGVFTGQPRSANIVAATKSGGIAIRKLDLEVILSRNPVMHVKVLQGIIDILCKRLAAADSQIERCAETIQRLGDQLEKAWRKQGGGGPSAEAQQE